jgi:beta-glucosidase
MDDSFQVQGLRFRDLDHDGLLAPYEDWRLPVRQRADDLLSRMTLTEKAGMMVHGSAPSIGPLGLIGVGTEYDLQGVEQLVRHAGVTALISRLSPMPKELATQNNEIQRIAALGRLGIPVTMSTDPRNHCGATIGASVDAGGFSRWPNTLGFGAIGDETLMRRFGEIVRAEYRAVGFHMALSPQADLATSPRWPRIDGTFGEDPELVNRLVGAYVEGIQGGRNGLSSTSVAAVVKHWVGYGASRDGFDGHNWYGRYSAFPSGRFQDHVDAFQDAFAAKVSGVMPTYNILENISIDGEQLEPVGAGFSKQLLTNLLRGTYAYDGVILSDWGITRDMNESCRTGEPPQTPNLIAMPWGVETLTHVEKFAKSINAGVDQIGGENDPIPIIDAVHAGLISETRIDDAVRRILVQKFELGLFENPFVDPDEAPTIVGNAMHTDEAFAAQHRSTTLIYGPRGRLIESDDRVFIGDLDVAPFTTRGIRLASDLANATKAIVRVDSPFELLHPNHFFGQRQHEGSLDFAPDNEAMSRLRTVSAVVPTIVITHLDRPAVLNQVVHLAFAVLAEFGATDGAIVDVLCGMAKPEGRLPFRLPKSMEQVLAQPCDGPANDLEPLFPLFDSAC